MRRLLLPGVVLFSAIAPAFAQSTPPASVASVAQDALLPDIEFAADVQMRSVTFGSAPAAGVTFTGGPRLDTRHDVERDGLDRPVVPRRTYRNAAVRTTFSATLLDPAAADPSARVPAPAAAPAAAPDAAAPLDPAPTPEDTP